MGKIALLFLLLIVNSNSYGQIDKEKDSLANEICKTIKETKNLSDSAMVAFVYKKHVAPFLLNYPEEQRDNISAAISFRLQRNCIEIQNIINRLSPPKGDWQTLEEKPKTQLDIKACRQFLEHKKYQYIEATGDTVNLTIEKGFWIDKFKDGTYSKLKFNWFNDCEFSIEFIESNNVTRKNFSKQGDKYKYQILDKKPRYYLMSAEIVGVNRYLTFKLYY